MDIKELEIIEKLFNSPPPESIDSWESNVGYSDLPQNESNIINRLLRGVTFEPSNKSAVHPKHRVIYYCKHADFELARISLLSSLSHMAVHTLGYLEHTSIIVPIAAIILHQRLFGDVSENSINFYLNWIYFGRWVKVTLPPSNKEIENIVNYVIYGERA